MNVSTVVRRFLVLPLVLLSVVPLTAAVSSRAEARGMTQAAPTPTPVTARTGGMNFSGGTCPSGFVMGQSGCRMIPVTGAGGTAGRNSVPATLPRTGGGSPTPNNQGSALALAALLLAAGAALAGWARRSALGR